MKRIVAAGKRIKHKADGSARPAKVRNGWATLASQNAEPAIASEPKYGAQVMMAPRPTRVLKMPQPLTIAELERLKILSHNPIERLENAWWEDAIGTNATEAQASSQAIALARDYYFAVSPEGQCLWIYRDLQSDEYFLHGYFD